MCGQGTWWEPATKKYNSQVISALFRMISGGANYMMDPLLHAKWIRRMVETCEYCTLAS
jgi:hypothetical protein